MDPLVSIIVPVYNVKPYLNRCVNSLLGQSYQNMELLLVDDGSTDGSETLCDEYAAQDVRVRVLHKKNGGLSDARNAGVDAAKGEYLSFVDGDDWVSPYYIENLYRALEQAGADFSASCFEEVFEGQPVQSVPTERLEAFEILSREECLRRILYQEGMEVTTPTKLYKRALFEGVRYPVGKLYEDIPVAYEVTKRAHKAAHIANRDYYYFQRGSSIQNMAFNPRKLDSVRHCHALMENVKRDFPRLSRAAECPADHQPQLPVCRVLHHRRLRVPGPWKRRLQPDRVHCQTVGLHPAPGLLFRPGVRTPRGLVLHPHRRDHPKKQKS